MAESGRELLQRAERSADPALTNAARAHRRELSASLVQARRWKYLSDRLTIALPLATLLLGAALVWTSARSARRMARGLSRPVKELVGWAERLGRGEALPAPTTGGRDEAGEIGALRVAFRGMESELAELRSRELEAERMQSWARMARTVAHELKNPLTPMRLAVRTLQARQAPPDVREALEVIAAESARLDELARSFSQFGRLPEGPESEIDLREMLDYLLRSHLPPGVAPRLKAPVDLPSIHGHHDALSRVFANLLLNAADAMEGEGSVTVVLRLLGEEVEVRIADNGPGISEENLPRIWEPDFTTRSRGTGLGLALVRQTIRSHGGRVEARNRTEGGAEFRVVLPIGRGYARSVPLPG